MSFLLPGLRRGALLATPLILSTPLLAHHYRHAQSIRCDSADPLAKLGDLRNTYAHDAQTPVITQSGAPNPKAFVESRGIHVVPYSYLQRRFKSTNVRSLVQDNVAFKLSFGLTFALAAFAEF
ncbi:hypothetical protein SLS59_001831 [Nothophoma quercina]|uniref:Uncharacterized protein n=1 Tax=Nothophoma quercina TaxID=749835 RepID=A0ABR3RW33_9PLEO